MKNEMTMKTLTKKYELHLEAAITIGELDPETDIQYLIEVLEAIQMPETDALYNPENGWTGVVPIDYARDLKRRLTIAREALDKLARLGNEPNFGYSDGNIIAFNALART